MTQMTGNIFSILSPFSLFSDDKFLGQIARSGFRKLLLLFRFPDVCWERVTDSVTRFGIILPLWQNFKRLLRGYLEFD